MKYNEMLFDGKALEPKVYIDSLNNLYKFMDTLHYYSIHEVYNELYRSSIMKDYANVMDFLLLLDLGYFKISSTDFDLESEVYSNGRKE